MARPRKNTPTDGELKVLRALWKLGTATLREVRIALSEADRPSASALATTMTAMLGKGSIRIVDERRPQKFTAVLTQDRTYTSILDDIRRRVFGGSLRDLVQHALDGRKQTPEEIADLRALLDKLATPKDSKR